MLAISQIGDQSQSQSSINVLTSFAFLVVLGVMPGLFVLFLHQKRRLARSDDFKKRFGVLYDDYKPFKSKYLVFMFIYFQRRFALAFIINFLSDYPNFQVYSQILQSLGIIILQYWIRPYCDQFVHFLELYNEASIMFVNYGFLAINMTNGQDEMQLYITYYLILHILINICINWIIFFLHLILFIKVKLSLKISAIKKRCQKKTSKRQEDYPDYTEKTENELNQSKALNKTLTKKKLVKTRKLKKSIFKIEPPAHKITFHDFKEKTAQKFQRSITQEKELKHEYKKNELKIEEKNKEQNPEEKKKVSFPWSKRLQDALSRGQGLKDNTYQNKQFRSQLPLQGETSQTQILDQMDSKSQMKNTSIIKETSIDEIAWNFDTQTQIGPTEKDSKTDKFQTYIHKQRSEALDKHDQDKSKTFLSKNQESNLITKQNNFFPSTNEKTKILLENKLKAVKSNIWSEIKK